VWQFSGPEDNLKDNDYKVISLDEIIILKSVLDIADLPLGAEAHRETKESSWLIN
jgi:hypothetical protein